MGITGPVLLLPKLWLQSLWESQIGWDQEVDIKSQDFLKWLKELEYLKHVQVPRWLHCISLVEERRTVGVIFVYNCVQEIRKLTPVKAWRHVPGSLNPADCPSRGCSAKQLCSSKWPLTYIHEDPEELPLSPAMFIHRNSNCETPNLDQVDRSSLVKRTKYLQKLTEIRDKGLEISCLSGLQRDKEKLCFRRGICCADWTR
ncbi:hypothetical protein TNCV_189191 [Trichonephila clavipes]|nr:hypothetical protein TNCV_189191 [Trichonephila clavipes]